MPRGKVLTDTEKAVIDALHAESKSARAIAVQIGRSQNVVSTYLRDPLNYGTKPLPGRPKKLSDRERRSVCRIASNSPMSANEIGRQAGVSVSNRTILRTIHANCNLVSAVRRPAPRMTLTHKLTRLEFARKNMARDWKKMSESKFYAVAHGFERGVFENWVEAKKQIDGFPQAVYKKFGSREEADAYLAERKVEKVQYLNPEDETDTFYAVARGRVVGIFSSFEDVKKHTANYPQAMQKKFTQYEEAKAYVDKFYQGQSAVEEKIEKKEIVLETSEKRETRASAKGAKTYYAVARGNKTGVSVEKNGVTVYVYEQGLSSGRRGFTEWSECQAATAGFKGARFKKFDNEHDAKLFSDGKPLKDIEAKRDQRDAAGEAPPPKKAKKT